MDKAMSAALMADFSTEQIGHKPATWCKACSAAVRNKTGKVCGDHRVVKCPKCKTSVTEAHTCLDFVGHADVRARLCEADPEWTWAPFDFPGTGSLILSDGHPVGLWITLTVGGVPKPGYGSVDKGKPEAMKELIGDALRNAGLSFGIAWKLWAKGERTSSEGEGGQSGAAGEAIDAAPHRNGNGSQQGQVSRPAAGRQEAAAQDETPDPDAQALADEASQCRALTDLKTVHGKAQEQHKLQAWVADPGTGVKGKLIAYLNFRKKALGEVDAALTDLDAASRAAHLDAGDLDIHVKKVTGVTVDEASAVQLRQAAEALREKVPA